MFDQDQIQEFKEAFNMIDQNRDGFIDNDDLKDMLASLGKVSNLIIMHGTYEVILPEKMNTFILNNLDRL